MLQMPDLDILSLVKFSSLSISIGSSVFHFCKLRVNKLANLAQSCSVWIRTTLSTKLRFHAMILETKYGFVASNMWVKCYF